MLVSALVVAVALIPGALAWWWGRAIASHAADADIGERLEAYRGRLIVPTLAAGVVVGVSSNSLLQQLGGLALLVLVMIAGWFSVRRAVFGDRWSLAAYLAHTGRLTIGALGFPLLVLVAPFAVPSDGPGLWAGVAALASALIAWVALARHISRWAYGGVRLRATGARETSLLARLEALAARSRIAMPRIYLTGPDDACVPLSVAAGTRDIVVWRTLMTELSEDELVALVGRDVCWLEATSRPSFRRWSLVGDVCLIAGACALPVLSWATAGAYDWGFLLAWPVAVYLGLIQLTVRLAPTDMDRDRRAAELCGDPAVVARAITRQAELARAPRRLAAETEEALASSRQHITSLARRLQALGELAPAGDAPYRDPASAAEPWPVAVRGAEPGAWVVLDADRITWLDGVPASAPPSVAELRATAQSTQTHAYAALASLVVRHDRERATLVSRDTSRNERRFRVEPDRLSQLQDALDRVDAKLAGVTRPPGARDRWAALALGGACAAAVFELGALPGMVLLPAVFALLQPTAAGFLALSGLTAIGASDQLVALARGEADVSGSSIVALLAAVAVAMFAGRVGLRRRKHGDQAGAGKIATSTALWLVIIVLGHWVTLLAPGAGPERLLDCVFSDPTLAYALGGIAGVLLGSSRRAVSIAGVCVAAGALLALSLSQLGTRDDGLIADTFPVGAALVGERTFELELDDLPISVRLSPLATRVAIAEHGDLGTSWTVYGASGPERRVDADEVAFVDDDTLVVAVFDRVRGETLVRAERLGGTDDPPDSWQLSFQGQRPHSLAVDPSSGRWQLMARGENRSWWRHVARLGDTEVTSTRFHPNEGQQLIAGLVGPAIAVELVRRGQIGELGETRLELLGPDHRQPLPSLAGYAACVAAHASSRTVCTTIDGPNVTSVWLIDPSHGSVELAGRHSLGYASAVAPNGAVILAGADEAELGLLDLAGDGAAHALLLADGPAWLEAVTATDSHIAITASTEHGASVAVYRYGPTSP